MGTKMVYKEVPAGNKSKDQGRSKTASTTTNGRTQSKSSSSSNRQSGPSVSKSAGSTSRSGSTSGSARSRTTTDHDEIRQWAEERGAHPACVKGTGGRDDIGMLRLDFPGYSGKTSLQQISWDEFFEKFDQRGLALLFQKKTSTGRRSNFNKIVNRGTAQEKPKVKAAR